MQVSNTETQKAVLSSKEECNNSPIYRYKFTPHIVELLTEFSKTHQYDPRKIYKESWNDFVNNNGNWVNFFNVVWDYYRRRYRAFIQPSSGRFSYRASLFIYNWS